MLLKIIWRGVMVLGMTKVNSSLKYKKMLVLCKREDFYSKGSSEVLSHITSLANPFSSCTEQVPWVSHRYKGLAAGLSSPILPQCLDKKTMNKMQSGVCGVQRGVLSLGTQKLTGEHDRQGNSSAVTMHWRVTLAPGVQGSLVPSRVALNTAYAVEKSTRTVLE